MAAKVGQVEDDIIAVFMCAVSSGEKCIVLLDDVEYFLGSATSGAEGSTDNGGENNESSANRRRRALFLTLLDALHAADGSVANDKGQAMTERDDEKTRQRPDILIVCTASTSMDGLAQRCDHVFSIHAPDEEERRQLILSCLDLCPDLVDNRRLQAASQGAARCSISELVQHCRHVVHKVSSSSGPTAPTTEKHRGNDLLAAFESMVRSAKPESVRSGFVDDFVDLTVSTAEHLIHEFRLDGKGGPSGHSMLPPLYGENTTRAWEKMKTLIVTPLCRSRELEAILHSRNDDIDRNSSSTAAPAPAVSTTVPKNQPPRVFCGGVLLTGPPGTGKTLLARFTAAYAALHIPAIKLLDVSCTSLVHKEVGGSERAMSRLFQTARACVPCVVLMEGIENVAAVRGNDNTTEGTMDRLLSTMLTELDGVNSSVRTTSGRTGLDPSDGRIVVIATTHNVNWIDPALRRPGRLDKVIKLQVPDEATRVQIIREELRGFDLTSKESNKDHADNGDEAKIMQAIADALKGQSGAQVVAACQDARFACLREAIAATGSRRHPDVQKTDTTIPRLCWRHFRHVPREETTGS